MTDPAALVTGAARRIGRAIALALHEAGYAVAIHARNSVADAEALRAQITRAGGRAAIVRADLADHAAAAALLPAARAAIGPLTLLVNNASSFEPDEIGALDAARFDRQFAVNLRAPLFLAEAFAAQAAGRGLDRQHPRSARVQAHAALRLLHAGEERAARGDAHAGAGARAQGARQRDRARADGAEPAPAAGGFCPPGGRGAARPRADTAGDRRGGDLSCRRAAA